MAQNLKHFNIRVYAVILNEADNAVLLSDEFQLGTRMTKFPGGGLHLGEGTIDCLKRESLEEFGQEIKIISHFYTTDFFQKALFYEDLQLISIYYLARFAEPVKFKISEKAFDFDQDVNGSQSFRWVKVSDVSPEMLTLPIDKKVAIMIKESLKPKS
jgi:ADP-ribose pyrophosphatase YjhB (NUDIX family)